MDTTVTETSAQAQDRPTRDAGSVSPSPAPTPDGATPRRRRPADTAVLLLLILAVFAFIYVARALLFPIIMAVVLALLLRPAVIAMQRLRIAESIGAAVVLVLVVTALGALTVHLYEPAARWAKMGPGELRRLDSKLRDLAKPVQAVRGATDKVAELANAAAPTEARKPTVVVERPSLTTFLGTAQWTVGALVATLLLLYFLLASGDLFLRKLIRVLPGLRDRKLAVEISRSVQAEIGRYFAMTMMINVGLGVATTLGMMALGMPSPALIGTAAALLNFVPYLGAALTLIGVMVVAALTFDTGAQVLLPVAAFLALSTIEGQFIQPILLGRHLALNPVVVFVWLLLWGWLWGVPGLLVAVPMLVALRICAERMPSLAPLAEMLSRD